MVNLSIAGRQAVPGMDIYGVAKAGLEMLTRVLAMELAPDDDPRRARRLRRVVPFRRQ